MVLIKDDSSKKIREQHIIVNLDSCNAYVQKLNETNFVNKKYKVSLTKIYPILPPNTSSYEWGKTISNDSGNEFENFPDKSQV